MIRLSSSLTSSKYIFHISESFSKSTRAAVTSGTGAAVTGGAGTLVTGGAGALVTGGTGAAVGISIVMQGPAATVKIRHAPTHHAGGLRAARRGQARGRFPRGRVPWFVADRNHRVDYATSVSES